MKRPKIGDIVDIYLDPLDEKKLEGRARLLYKLNRLDWVSDKTRIFERWFVKFEDGSETIRVISFKKDLEENEE